MAVAKKNLTTSENPAEKKTAASKTVLKVDKAPAKRGRPPTGEALTASERKKLQRERDLARGITDQSVDGLLKSAGVSIAAGNVEDLKALNSEMLRRAKINFKKRMSD